MSEEIRAISPSDERLSHDNHLIREVVEIFNAHVLSRAYIHRGDEKAIEMPMKYCGLSKVMDAAVEIINRAGWEARHDHFYGEGHPSYGILFKPASND